MSFSMNWLGASGTSYTYFNLENVSHDGIKAVAGNYCFAKQLPNGNFVPLYFGQAENLRDRIVNHDRWADARKLGVTHVLAHTKPGGEQIRCNEEKDLIAKWNPPLNVQHRRTI